MKMLRIFIEGYCDGAKGKINEAYDEYMSLIS